jgi:hypothetical protein
MSLLIAATMSLGQFCYDADKDIHAAEFMRAASFYETVLIKAMESEQSQCWAISTEKEHQEAKKLVSMDSTGETLTLQ